MTVVRGIAVGASLLVLALRLQVADADALGAAPERACGWGGQTPRHDAKE